MKSLVSRIKKVAFAGLAIAVVFALVSVLIPSNALAAGQVTSRSITMSSSNASDTGVSYQIGFTTASTSTIKGIVVDFCSTSPIISDTCTAPSGFTVGTPTVTTSGAPNTGLTGSWTAGSLNSGRTLTLINASGGSISSGTSVIFTLSTVTNPSTTGSFYARILDYTTTAGATSYTDTVPGTYVDYGGIALSTAAVINITAKVQESLTFCVYHSACGDSTSLNLGQTVGSQVILDNNAVYTAQDKFSVATNAQHGVVVNMKGDTLKFSTFSINPAGTTAIAFVAGTEDFGMCVSPGAGVTAIAPYLDSTATCATPGGTTKYGLDVTSGTNITSTYGQQIATLAGPSNTTVSTTTFAATASLTTTAGIYTAAEQLIATATF